jgi:hypothetical protein
MNIKTMASTRRTLGNGRRCQIRFYFDIPDTLAIRDQVGRDLKTVLDAIMYAKYLAADFRCLEPDAGPRRRFRSWTKAISESTRKLSSLRPSVSLKRGP